MSSFVKGINRSALIAVETLYYDREEPSEHISILDLEPSVMIDTIVETPAPQPTNAPITTLTDVDPLVEQSPNEEAVARPQFGNRESKEALTVIAPSEVQKTAGFYCKLKTLERA